MDEETIDYYDVLSVSPKATAEEIRRAWHRKMMLFHPDHHLAEQKKYEAISVSINLAYKVLSDPNARAAFDAWRAKAIAGKQRALAAKRAVRFFEKITSAVASARKKIFSRESLSAAEKIILTLLTAGGSALFFCLPKWEFCGDPIWRCLLAGCGNEALANPIFVPSVLIGIVFAGTVLVGKRSQNRLAFFSFYLVFLLALSCAETLVIPLREHETTAVGIAAALGLLGIFGTYKARKNLAAGILLRVILTIACVLAYRAGKLVFAAADELVTVGCFLTFLAFLVACFSAVMSARD